MTVDLCYFLAFKGSWAAQENEGAFFLEGWGPLFPASPPPPRMHRASLCCFCLSGYNLDNKREAQDGWEPFHFLAPWPEHELASQTLINLLKCRLTKSSLILLLWVKWLALVSFLQPTN